MEHLKFFESHNPEPWTIFGLRLKPFSLGHLFLLHRIESPFVSDGKRDLIDLLQAVKFCSMTYPEGVAFLDSPDAAASLQRWARRLTGTSPLLVRLGWKYTRRIDWAEKADMFRKYLDEGSTCPEFEFSDEATSEVGLPLCQVVKVTLWKHLNVTEAELMDRPWGLCLHDFITLKAIDGLVELVDGDLKDEAQRKANELFKRYNPELFEEA